MKALHTATITIAIVLMIIVSPMAFGTLSFAARTNSTGTSAQHNNKNNITASSSKIPNINTPKITTTTTTNPASHNATTTNTTLMGAPGSGYTCSPGDNFLWNHVYGVTTHGNEPWKRPDPTHTTPSRLEEKTPPCIRVTGTVYSAYPGGTHEDPDGDLHFTLTLDNAYKMYSNGKPGPDRIIVEVICHNPGLASKSGYFTKWGGDYCSGVHSEFTGFPKQGAKLTVSGKFVYDKGEGWNEIHPASNINPNH